MSFESRDGLISLHTTLWLVWERRVLLVKPTDTDPKRRTWRLPAVELRHGEHPEDVANRMLNDLGVARAALGQVEIDSRVTGEDWRLGFRYRADVSGDVVPGPTIFRHGWFGAHELPPAERFAGGNHERQLAARCAEAAPTEI